jgi:hypothetical protein
MTIKREIKTEKQHTFFAASTALSTSFEDPAEMEVMTFPVAFGFHVLVRKYNVHERWKVPTRIYNTY